MTYWALDRSTETWLEPEAPLTDTQGRYMPQGSLAPTPTYGDSEATIWVAHLSFSVPRGLLVCSAGPLQVHLVPVPCNAPECNWASDSPAQRLPQPGLPCNMRVTD